MLPYDVSLPSPIDFGVFNENLCPSLNLITEMSSVIGSLKEKRTEKRMVHNVLNSVFLVETDWLQISGLFPSCLLCWCNTKMDKYYETIDMNGFTQVFTECVVRHTLS